MPLSDQFPVILHYQLLLVSYLGWSMPAPSFYQLTGDQSAKPRTYMPVGQCLRSSSYGHLLWGQWRSTKWNPLGSLLRRSSSPGGLWNFPISSFAGTSLYRMVDLVASEKNCRTSSATLPTLYAECLVWRQLQHLYAPALLFGSIMNFHSRLS